MIRVRRLLRKANAQESKQHPAEQGSDSCKKRLPTLARRIPVRVTIAVAIKKEERRV